MLVLKVKVTFNMYNIIINLVNFMLILALMKRFTILIIPSFAVRFKSQYIHDHMVNIGVLLLLLHDQAFELLPCFLV